MSSCNLLLIISPYACAPIWGGGRVASWSANGVYTLATGSSSWLQFSLTAWSPERPLTFCLSFSICKTVYCIASLNAVRSLREIIKAKGRAFILMWTLIRKLASFPCLTTNSGIRLHTKLKLSVYEFWFTCLHWDYVVNWQDSMVQYHIIALEVNCFLSFRVFVHGVIGNDPLMACERTSICISLRARW